MRTVWPTEGSLYRSKIRTDRNYIGGDTLKNMKIRIKLLEHNKRLWWLADLLGTSEATISRRLRKELPEDEQDKIIQLIEEKAGEEG